MKTDLKTIIEKQDISQTYLFDALVTNVTWNLTSSGKPYLRMMLRTNKVTVNGTKWSTNQEEFHTFQTQHYLTLKGRLTFFNNGNQIIIEDWKVIPSEAIDHQALLPLPPQKLATMEEEFHQFLTAIKDPDYQLLLKTVFTPSNLKLFYQTRAAVKFHHNLYGGLLWHTLTMLKAAQKLIKIYDFLPIDNDLLYTGIICHDLGKIKEIDDFFASSYSLEGNLLGHISIGALWLERVAVGLKINPTKKMLLQHLILASHGQLEYGSPTQPATIEAVLLHQLDSLDATMGKIFNLYNSQAPNSAQKTLVDNFWFHYQKKAPKEST